MKLNKNILKEISVSEEEMAQLTDRALILLSFSESAKQSLGYLLNLLEIRTLQEKKNILQEIFRLIREGIVYLPQGLPTLVEEGAFLDINHDNGHENIDLCLLCPYDQLIQEIKNEISKMRAQNGA